MKTVLKLLTLILCLTCCPCISGQDQSVHLHTDRSYYVPGEPILFRAYLSEIQNNKKLTVNDTLHLYLLDQFGVEVASASFPVNNSMITGNVVLPDFLNDGNYVLIANTNSMKDLSTEKIFSRIFEIRKSVDEYLIANLSISDAIYEPGEEFAAQIRFSGKDNIPVPASFSYQLIGNKEEILNGNNKANSDGIANIKFKLPKFDSKESLKLIFIASYRGTKNITGVFIPTPFNKTDLKTKPAGSSLVNKSKHLGVQLKAINSSSDKNVVQVEISVTDEQGNPAKVNLSVSVSNLLQHQLNSENDNIISSRQKNDVSDAISNPDIKEYFTQYLVQKTQSPGTPFIVQEKNNTKKLHKLAGAITMKKSKEYIKNVENSAKPESNTLFWGPDIMTDNSGKATFSFYNNGKTQEVLISVDGRAADGTFGSSTIQYSVK